MWQKRPRELEHRLLLEKEEMTLPMQWAVSMIDIYSLPLRTLLG